MSYAALIVDALLENDDLSPEDLIRHSGIFAQAEDFIVDTNSAGGRWPNGNYYYSVSYKHILMKGKPLYLGLLLGCHDYNTTGTGELKHFYIEQVPSWVVQPLTKTGQKSRKHPARTYYGSRGIYAMDRPESKSFTTWIDAARYLLSLVRHNSRLTPALSVDTPR